MSRWPTLTFASPQAWLEHYAIPVPESGCWLFERATSKAGYGQLFNNGSVRYASRIAYELFHGPIPDGLLVCHTCDVPLCVNPKHLFIGTHADNMRDMAAKGRAANKPHTHCKRGHELIHPAWSKQGLCRICMNERARRYYRKKIKEAI